MLSYGVFQAVLHPTGFPSRSRYASPAAWAEDIVARTRFGGASGISKKTLYSARRIHRLLFGVKADLEKARAPMHVFRWVAWAPTGRLAAQRQRADLALHIHRTFACKLDGWFGERQHRAALEAWVQASVEAREQRHVELKIEEVPVDVYEAALETVPKRVRRAAPPPHPAPVVDGAMVLRALVRALEVALQRPSAGAAAVRP